MKTAIYQSSPPGRLRPAGLRAGTLACFLLLGLASAGTASTVTTLGGGPLTPGGPSYGYQNGSIIQDSQFNYPMGIALDPTETLLYVADYTNNAVRLLDMNAGLVETFVDTNYNYVTCASDGCTPVATNYTTGPVDVKVDSGGNVYVLTRGNGSNGTVLMFDSYANFLGVLAAQLTNAAALALDGLENVYVVVQGNTVVNIDTLALATNTVAVITNVGTSLSGLVIMDSGLIAASDAGNHGIWMINPTLGIYTNSSKYVGFKGPGDVFGSTNFAKFNTPKFIAKAGSGWLVVADYGNHRVKVVDASGTVENLYGVCSNLWVSQWPGWADGDGCSNIIHTCDYCTNYAEARMPMGVVMKSDGTVYTTEVYYDLIREATATGLPLPPPPPPAPVQVSAPEIGWVDYPAPNYTSVLQVNSSSLYSFNNDVNIQILPLEQGVITYFTFGPTPVGRDTIPDPGIGSGSTPPAYENGWYSSQVSPSIVSPQPDLTIKAISVQVGRPNSAIVKARFQFITASPTISGNNAALFTLNDITAGAAMWYTWDGTDPTNGLPSIGPVFDGAQVSTNLSGGALTFKVRAFRSNYAPSGVASRVFSTTNFVANTITFGLTNGQPHSRFLARPGQFFYAPVTLNVLSGTEMYSLQFNVAVTNGLATTNKVVNGAGIDFFSMLMSQVPPSEGDHFPPNSGQWYLEIPPFLMTTASNLVGVTTFVDTNNNVLGVGWLYRVGYKYVVINPTNGVTLLDFDTSKQDLISYSIPHDTLFTKANGVVVVGAYSFQVPTKANIGDQYFIQLGSPSATSDGIGDPGSSVYIQPPAASTAVTVGTPSYLVGDAAPFSWLNAGDFGDGMLDNADVMQVFQSAILGDDMPPANSDLYQAMDSCGAFYVDLGHGYLERDTTITDTNLLSALFNGDDTTINQIAFGDGVLDICDVYVTLRRSLDPSLVWFERFWTNGQLVAVTTPNLAFNSNSPSVTSVSKAIKQTVSSLPGVSFTAGDAIASAGQTIQIPITASVCGSYPIRVLGLNVTVYPLDGSPALTQPVQFAPAAGLGQPTIASPKYAANYSAGWLDSTVSGLSGSNANVGMLQITIPTNATASAAYAIRFDHVSASPNGIGSFPKQTHTGLVTLSDRSASSWGDGIPDSWRLRYFGSVNNPLSAANADPDGDGMSNWQEYLAGTDPTDGSSNFKLKPVGNGGSPPSVTVQWPSVAGKTYVVEATLPTSNLNWVPVCTNTGTGWNVGFQDTTGSGARWYRVKVLP
jgi:hypothetical protein